KAGSLQAEACGGREPQKGTAGQEAGAGKASGEGRQDTGGAPLLPGGGRAADGASEAGTGAYGGERKAGRALRETGTAGAPPGEAEGRAEEVCGRRGTAGAPGAGTGAGRAGEKGTECFWSGACVLSEAWSGASKGSGKVPEGGSRYGKEGRGLPGTEQGFSGRAGGNSGGDAGGSEALSGLRLSDPSFSGQKI